MTSPGPIADPARFRREFTRWLILLTLNNARPEGTTESLILSVIRGEFPDVTASEIRRELDYLKDRALVSVRVPPDGSAWWCELTRTGVDVAEYTVDVEPGIARPAKYF
jgi:hypothetical protein